MLSNVKVFEVRVFWGMKTKVIQVGAGSHMGESVCVCVSA